MSGSLSLSLSLSLSPTLTLTRISTTRSTVAVSARRNNSHKPDVEVAMTEEEIERYEEMVQDRIERSISEISAPDWLPLVPGGSYWIPPQSKSRGLAQSIATADKDPRVAIEFTKYGVSFGLPYSAQFFKGSSNSPLEVEETDSKNSNQSEEDKGTLSTQINEFRSLLID